MKISEIRERADEDLASLEKDLASQLFKSRMENFTNQLNSTAQLGQLRRDIARVKTVIRERELEKAKG